MIYDLSIPDDKLAMPERQEEEYRTLRIPKGDGYTLGGVGDKGTAIIQYEIVSEERDCCYILVKSVDTSIPDSRMQQRRDNTRITFKVPDNGEDALEKYAKKKGK